MARDAETVSVADVIRAVDGPLVSVYGLRPEAVSYNESAEVLQHVWIAARSSLRDVFEHVSIRALADGKLPKAVTSRTAVRGRLAAALTDVGGPRSATIPRRLSRQPRLSATPRLDRDDVEPRNHRCLSLLPPRPATWTWSEQLYDHLRVRARVTSSRPRT